MLTVPVADTLLPRELLLSISVVLVGIWPKQLIEFPFQSSEVSPRKLFSFLLLATTPWDVYLWKRCERLGCELMD